LPADTPRLPTCCSRGKPVRNAEGQLNVHVGDHCRYRLCGLASLDQRITSGQSARSWPVGVTQPKVPDKARQRQPEERRPPGPQGLQNLQDPRGSKWQQRAIEEKHWSGAKLLKSRSSEETSSENLGRRPLRRHQCGRTLRRSGSRPRHWLQRLGRCS